MVELHADQFNRALFYDRGSTNIVICFGPRHEPPPAECFGIEFCEKLNLSSIHIVSNLNTWYLDGEFLQYVLPKIKVVAKEYEDITTYGFSMGSFGAFIHGRYLGASRIIVGAPVLYIAERFENRWLGDYSKFLHCLEGRDSFDGSKSFHQLYAIFDPEYVDARHVELARASEKVIGIKVPYAGHEVGSALKEMGLLSKFVSRCIHGSLDVNEAEKDIFALRKRNVFYLLHLIRRLERKRKSKLLKRAVSLALKEHPDNLDILVYRMRSLCRESRGDDALDILRGLISKREGISRTKYSAMVMVEYIEAGGDVSKIIDLIGYFRSSAARNREAQLWFSRLLRVAKLHDEAYEAHLPFMKGDAFQGHAHFERGLILESLGLFQAAAAEYNESLNYMPNSSSAIEAIKKLRQRQKIAF